MALKWLSEAQRAVAKSFGSIDRRVYIDLRKQEYPAIAGSATFTKVDNDLSLVARWRLDENAGAIAYDDSGNGANLTIAGGVSWAPGRWGKCLDFNGTTGYASGAVGALGATWSYSFWIYVDSLPGTGEYNIPLYNSDAFGFLLNNLEGTGQRIYCEWKDSGGASRNVQYKTELATATWYHVVVTHTGTTTLIYLNNVVVATGSTYDSQAEGAQTYYVGRHKTATGYFDGRIDEIRLYSRLLSQDEVTQLYTTNALNLPGSHYLSGGYGKYLMPLTSFAVVDVLAKPTFDLDTASYDKLFSFYVDATHYLDMLYLGGGGRQMYVRWCDGGTERQLYGTIYTTDAEVQAWQRFTGIFNLTTGTTAGSSFYINGSVVDTQWSGNINVKASNFPTLELRSEAGDPNRYNIAYARIWLLDSAAKLPTATDVANNFKTYKEEEIYFDLNGTATGRTRANVTHAVRSVGLRKARYGINQSSPNPVVATLSLMNENGRFADDQFASADFANDYYNGQASQAFLQYQCPVEIESWYGATGSAAHVETEFLGRTEVGAFARRTGGGDISMVSIEANDRSNEMARRRRSKSYSYSSAVLVGSAGASNSLLHNVCGLGTNREWYDFAANNGFENAAISATWQANADTSLARGTSGPFMGTYDGELYRTNTSTLTQWVRFTGDKRIESGQNWTLSGYVKATASATFSIGLSTRTSADAVVETISKVNSYRGGSGWERLSVRLYVSATASVDRMKLYFDKSASGAWHVDAVQLVQNHEPLNYWWDNNASGVAGLVDADDAVSDEYEVMGIDADEVAGTVPWALIPAGDPIWAHVSDIGHAALSRTCGVSPCGTFVLRSPLKSGYADPSPLFTVSDSMGLDSVIDVDQANKLIVHGVYIVTGAALVTVWSAESASVFSSSVQGGKLREVIADGDYWPNAGDFPEFYAKYEELK